MNYYPPGFGSASDWDHVEGALSEIELDEECPRCHNAGDCGLIRQVWRSGGPTVFCTGCDYEREEDVEWCCDAGLVGHGGRHWKED